MVDPNSLRSEGGNRAPDSPNGATAPSKPSLEEERQPDLQSASKASIYPDFPAEDYKDSFRKLLDAELSRNNVPFSINTAGGIKLLTQIFFSLLVIGFCMWQLTHSNKETETALYWSGITTLVAWWMPSPRGGT